MALISTHARELPDGFPEKLRADLHAAGKNWYALYHWGHLIAEPETTVWFLNAAGNNNFGLFTLADLSSWVTNQGPIPKQS